MWVSCAPDEEQRPPQPARGRGRGRGGKGRGGDGSSALEVPADGASGALAARGSALLRVALGSRCPAAPPASAGLFLQWRAATPAPTPPPAPTPAPAALHHAMSDGMEDVPGAAAAASISVPPVAEPAHRATPSPRTPHPLPLPPPDTRGDAAAHMDTSANAAGDAVADAGSASDLDSPLHPRPLPPLPPLSPISPLPPLSPVLAAETEARRQRQAEQSEQDEAAANAPAPSEAASMPQVQRTPSPAAVPSPPDEATSAVAVSMPRLASPPPVPLPTVAAATDSDSRPPIARPAAPMERPPPPAAAASAAVVSTAAMDEEEDVPMPAAFDARGPPAIPADFQLGFSTGAGSRVAISATAMAQAQRRMQRAEAEEARAAAGQAISMHPPPPALPSAAASAPLAFSSFRDGRMQPCMNISEEALARARAFMESVDQEEEGDVTAQAHAGAHAPPSAGLPLMARTPSAAFKRPGSIASAGRRHVRASLPLPQPDELSSSQGSAAPAAPRSDVRLITGDSLLAEDGSPADPSTIPAAQPLPALPAAVPARLLQAAPPPAPAPPAQTLSPDRIRAGAAFMEACDDHAAADPAAVSATDDAASGGPLPSSSSSTHAVKRRKSNFSSVLPLPHMETETEEEAEAKMDGHAEAAQQTHARQQQPQQQQHQQQPQRQQESPQPQQPQMSAELPAPVTPMAPARPAVSTSTASTPSSNVSAFKRRAAAFKSPRVANKPVLPLVSTLQQQPSLLSVKRPAAAMNGGGGMNGSSNGASNGASAQQGMPQLASGMHLSFPSTVPTSAKMTLRQFDALCQAKLVAAMASLDPSALSLHAPCTSIPVDAITSVNAADVLFVPPLGAPASVDPYGRVVPSLGWLHVRSALLALGLPASLCSIAWVRNQYRWVVWKLACYDRRFGPALPEPACAFQRVVTQCAARYEREFNRVQTPALKKIMEGDEGCGKFLVLIVAQVVTGKAGATGAAAADGPQEDSGAIPARPAGCLVEVSDGWYSVWCKVDAHLHALVQQGKIRAGQKLRVWGAQLDGPTPVTPLENTNTTMKIFVNGVRRARWDTKLGVQRRAAFLVNMASLRPDGGPVPAIRVAISKQYPIVHLHPPSADEMPVATPPSTGSSAPSPAPEPPKPRKLHCNQRAHDLRMGVHQKLCEKRMEVLRRGFEDRQSRNDGGAYDPEKAAAAEEEWNAQRTELEAELQDLVKQVIPYLKLHMCELTNNVDGDRIVTDAPLRWSGQCCLFTVWRPGDDHLELLMPGKELIIYGCAVHARFKPHKPVPSDAPIDLLAPPHSSYSSSSSHYLQLSTSRHTNIVPRAKLPGAVVPSRVPIPLRTEFLRHPLYMRPGELWNLPRGAEFDLVCLVLSVQEGLEQPDVGHGGSVRLLRQRRLLCVGMSGDLLLVEVNESREHVYFAATIPVPQVMAVENLVYQRYEKQLRMHVATATVLTLFKPKGVVHTQPKDPAALAVSHSLFAHPTVGHFHNWLSTPLTAQLHGLIDGFGQRIVTGTLGGGQVIAFNRSDFAELLSYPVSGYVQPPMTPSHLSCSVRESLTSILLPPFTVPPPVAAPDAAPSADTAASVSSSITPASTVTPLAKKRGPSLLSTGSAHKPPSTGSHPAAPLGDDVPIAEDCMQAGASGVCYHPCHTLSHLLDAAHWGMQLCLDDGAGARWPLHINSHVFRRIVALVDSSTALDACLPLRDSWVELMRSGDVPYVGQEDISGSEEVTLLAMRQLRQHVCQGIAQQLHMGEDHQAQQVADIIMLVLSHSAVLPLSSCVDAVSPFLGTVCNRWRAALSVPAPSRVVPPAHSSPPPPSPPLLTTHIVCSLSQPEEVRVEVQLTGSQMQPTAEEHTVAAAAAAADPDAMDTSEQAGSNGAEKADGGALDEVQLAEDQMAQVYQLLTDAHAARMDGLLPSPSVHPPLLFFTTSEWDALCEELCAAMGAVPLCFQLAECERYGQSGLLNAQQRQHRVTAQPFRSVFLPHPERIRRK